MLIVKTNFSFGYRHQPRRTGFALDFFIFAFKILFTMSKILSKESYQRLKEEIEILKKESRREIAERIKTARGFGDLSENAEYKEALDAQSQLELRIFQLENVLREATVIKSSREGDKIRLGSAFEVKNLRTGKKQKMVLVSFNEVSPLEGKISPESPLGAAFVGRKKGDVVEVEIAAKKQKFQVSKIIK